LIPHRPLPLFRRSRDPATVSDADLLRHRNLLFLRHPERWPLWPHLPLVKRSPPGTASLGVVADARGVPGREEYAWDRFLANVVPMPTAFAELLELPREHDRSPEALDDAGWHVD
jgi:hypothetical protein